MFLADPGAPIADVAREAGVGISALYRRYPGKEALMRALAEDGLTRYVADLRAALEDDGDEWEAYRDCLRRVVAGQSHALARRVAGAFTPTPELTSLAAEAGRLATELHLLVQAAGVLRADVTPADVTLLLEMIMAVELPGPGRGRDLRLRYLDLVLQALRAPGRAELAGTAATEAALR